MTASAWTSSQNPLLADLGLLHDEKDLPRLLYRKDLPRNASELDEIERLDALDDMDHQIFVPTHTAISVARGLFRMIRRGYQSRNPADPRANALDHHIGRQAAQSLTEIGDMTLRARAMSIVGITGLGKSYEVASALRLLPQHVSRAGEAGARLSQIVWLFVPVSFDGSIAGFLESILLSIDNAAGTSYFVDPSLKRLSAERLAVRVSIILRNHRVGVLVIDELQGRTFGRGPHSNLLPLFFLRILNVGIPVVLIGNPSGITALERYAQDVRRLSSGGYHRYDPLDANDPDWRRLAKTILSFNLLPSDPEFGPETLWSYCAGIRDYAVRAWKQAQGLAIQNGDSFVGKSHLDAAFAGNGFSERDRDLIIGLRDRDPARLAQFQDVSLDRYLASWGTREAVVPAPVRLNDDGRAPQTKASQPEPLAMATSFKARRTRQRNKELSRQTLKESLSPDDLRKKAWQDVMVSDMESLSRAPASVQRGDREDS